ncbi:TPA: protein-disulfide reductase DsbD [Vibrio vulnificus]|uniref:protein-disulfide reductase DsbD n=1 Tax=Vibrio vulnificus TaxID=672 RepID=UPI001A3081AA|nr:protein-disulfide reductase DsbD [Vibrio vulnificus]ELY5145526.1 protein-disulfide reductase DsbD [Vibrio vulnificus]MCA0761922.1 protein-disulfide reductase DsbD [Vibrio vulnificus]MCU8317293.1 protein-disulfide reductase DsbD [Vibrio vulnificus]HAS6189969.1 protein-disulfide reductase DsbD [Vibrio vulnificus]HAS6252669.1 protein-disulfide reductase DsbD [Vibrio vulnificus]
MRALLTFFVAGLLVLSSPAMALFGNNQNSSFASGSNDFVPVDQAFPFNYFQQDHRITLDWQVKEGYYLYQQRLSFSAENVVLGDIQMENGQPYRDEFFGDVNIYTNPLFVNIPMQDWQPGAKLIVQYQGCAKAGFCYPPETRVIDITSFTNGDMAPATMPTQTASNLDTSTANASTPQPLTQQDQLASGLADNWWTPLLFLALGVGLAFTPCVLPMYPILTSIVLGSGKLSQRRALGLSLVYVQGMALTYTLLGLVVASAGLQFQAAMQHPYVLIGLSILFVTLALSMFGVYTLQLPSSVQTWLNNLSNKQQGGSSAGVFAMGAISGLVCSPCTTAPLSGALLYVAQSGDLLTGGVALYALAMGMGIPLILVAVFGNKLLPKAGGWMDRVKTLFGFVLLAAPIFLLERILPEMWSTALWSALGIAAFGWLYHVKNSLEFGGWKQSAVGIIAVLGLFASAQPALNYWFADSSQQAQTSEVSFIKIRNVEELQQQLALAKQAKKPVMLDFYADWCVACKEFEKYTFHDPAVAAQLKQFVLLQADVTRNQAQDIELLQAQQVLGLPTIDFWDAQGNPVSNARLTGFMQAAPFLEHIQRISN